jgi:hypothetical protein
MRSLRCVITGPAECGKSVLAEQALASRPGPLVYVATLQPSSETSSVIERHRARRDGRWQLVELEGDPAGDLARLGGALEGTTTPLLIDGFATLLAWLGYNDQGIQTEWLGRVLGSVKRWLLERSGPWCVVDGSFTQLSSYNVVGLAEAVDHFHWTLVVEGGASMIRL